MDTLGTFTPDNLLAGEQMSSLLTKAVVIAAGAGSLVRGTVLGKITEGGEYTGADSEAIDGSATACGILVRDVDASSVKQPAVMYFSGEFNRDRLVCVGYEQTIDDFEEDLLACDIVLRSPVSNGD
jgi:hypothetical protein